MPRRSQDRKSTRLNSSHTVIYTLSLHDALPIFPSLKKLRAELDRKSRAWAKIIKIGRTHTQDATPITRSEEHTSELQSHRDLHSFPTRRSSDLSLLEEIAGGARQKIARLGEDHQDRSHPYAGCHADH